MVKDDAALGPKPPSVGTAAEETLELPEKKAFSTLEGDHNVLTYFADAPNCKVCGMTKTMQAR